MQNIPPTPGDVRVVSRALPLIVAVTFFMEYLDMTVIATALPQMAQSFGVGPNEVSLGMTAYMLTLAVFIPVSGWLADRLGSRTVFGGALVVFTVASVLCGLSQSLAAFTAARVLQGIGGAMMVPVGRMIVVRNSDKSQMMRAISMITWPAIIAPVIGPSLGGFVTTYATWHWIFFLNIPVGILALIAIAHYVPNQRESRHRPLDLKGFLLVGAALIALLYGTELASHQDASLIRAAACLCASLLLGIAAIRHLRTTANPLLNLTILRTPTFAVTVLWASATRVGIEAVPYLTPLLLQIGFGMTAFRSGLFLLATACGNLGMKLFTTPILRRWGFRNVALINGAVAAMFVLGCAALLPATPLGLTLLILFGYGLARSLQFTTLATLAYADVGDEQRSAASTLWSVAQQMTIGMGVAFGALGLRIAKSIRGHDAPQAAVFALGDFRWAFVAAALLIAVSLIGYIRLSRDAGHAISART